MLAIALAGSVAAEPRPRLLELLAERAGFTIRGLHWVPADDVTMRVTDVAPGDALRQLLSPVNFVVIEEASHDGPRPVLVVILGPRTQRMADPDPPEIRSGDTDARLRADALDEDANVQMTALAILTERDPSAALRVAVEAASVGDASARLSALHVASRFDVIRIEALRHALVDPDPEVRDYAVQALAQDGRPAARDALAAVVDDPDPVFRQSVREVLRHVPAR